MAAARFAARRRRPSAGKRDNKILFARTNGAGPGRRTRAAPQYKLYFCTRVRYSTFLPPILYSAQQTTNPPRRRCGVTKAGLSGFYGLTHKGSPRYLGVVTHHRQTSACVVRNDKMVKPTRRGQPSNTITLERPNQGLQMAVWDATTVRLQATLHSYRTLKFQGKTKQDIQISKVCKKVISETCRPYSLMMSFHLQPFAPSSLSLPFPFRMHTFIAIAASSLLASPRPS